MPYVLAKHGGIISTNYGQIIIAVFYPRPWELKILPRHVRTITLDQCGAISQNGVIKQASWKK